MDTTIPSAGDKWLLPSVALSRAGRSAPLGASADRATHDVRFGFLVGSLAFLVEQGELSELLADADVYPIPGMPPEMRGYVNRQGSLIPVWDLHRVLDEDRVSTDRVAVVLLGRGDRRVGVVVDELPRAVRQLRPAERIPDLPAALVGHVSETLLDAQGQLWLTLGYESFFLARVMQCESRLGRAPSIPHAPGDESTDTVKE